MKISIIEYKPPSMLPVVVNHKWDKRTWEVDSPGHIIFLLTCYGFVLHRVRLEWRKGFITDGGSVPRIGWRITGHPMGDWLRDYLTHDALYAGERFDRKFNDQIFRSMLKEDGCWFTVRSIIYLAVRLCGGITGYKSHTAESVEMNRELCPLWVDGVLLCDR